jgi:hypothetical protein
MLLMPGVSVNYVNGYELDINNNSGVSYGTGIAGGGLASPAVHAMTINGVGTAGKTITSAITLISSSGGGQALFERGFVVGPAAVVQAAFDDYSNATASYRDTGAHTFGMDLSGSYTSAAVRVSNNSAYASKRSNGAIASLMTLDGTNRNIISTSGVVDTLVNTSFYPNADNTFALGGTSLRWASVWAANGTIQTSDATLKNVIGPIDAKKASAFIDALEPKRWKWIVGGKEPIYEKQPQEVVLRVDKVPVEMPTKNGTVKFDTDVPVTEMHDVDVVVGYKDVPGKRTHFGVLASDVKAAAKAAKLGDFGGYVMGEDGVEAIRPDQLLAIALTEIRSLRKRVAAIEAASRA